MYAISDKYKNHLETSDSISLRNKLVVDGVEYLGDVIKTNPKVSHLNSSIFGGFPAKTLSFEIYNLNNDINFENKEIYCYKGIEIDGVVEYVPQGIFVPKSTDITTNLTTRTVTFNNIQDRTQLLDDVYTSNLDWTTSHTGLEIVQEICTKKGITLGTTNFNFASYVFENQPNFSSTITNREVISRIAQIGGEIAFFNNVGNLAIKSPTPTGHTLSRKRYEKLSHEKPFVVNTVVLGKEGVEDTIVYPETITGERVEYRINDNPFVDLIREQIIGTVASFIVGKSIIPFDAQNVVDGYYLELNDSITIIDKNNDSFEATILNYETSNRIKTNLKAEIQTSISNYNLAGSNKQSLNAVKLEVDHNKQEISAVADKVDANEEAISVLKLDAESISASVTNIEKTTDDALKDINKDIASLSKSVEATITAEDVNIAIKNEMANGVNKVETTTGFKFDENGLTISKTGSEMTTAIDEDGMTISRDNEEVLVADHEGVKAYNLHANTYLIIGESSRFEDYEKDGETRTGCFWIGGGN